MFSMFYLENLVNPGESGDTSFIALILFFYYIQCKHIISKQAYMIKKYWTLSEVIEIIQVDEGTISYLEEEEVICPECFDVQPAKQCSAVEREKLDRAKVLMEDMDVNLPGVEVILRMRETMIQMRRQFDAILEDLAGQFKESIK